MLVLGINGSQRTRADGQYSDLDSYFHNSAAALLRDGEVVAAIEEERLDRLKHSHKAPLGAIAACLEIGGVSLGDVDAVAFYLDEGAFDAELRNDALECAGRGREPLGATTGRQVLQRLLAGELGVTVPLEKYRFVRHHVAHALSALLMSGYQESLVVTWDGAGDFEAGLVGMGATEDGRQRYVPLQTIAKSCSLGTFYLKVINYLGYDHFDEYKVMGLAPYGDPAVYRARLATVYQLGEDGRFSFAWHNLDGALASAFPPRRRGEPFTQDHRDLAAALQEALEEIALHVLRHHRQRTGSSKLCLAGGVALNCSLNGKIMRSGLFDGIFVQPASDDAGCALGAALSVELEAHPERPRLNRRLSTVYWGRDVGSDETIRGELARWSSFLRIQQPPSIVDAAAGHLAEGRALGWVHGRSEFGPRSLGHRSILADPRPVENKSRINAIVKKREGYRPFAPSVQLERMREYFEVPEWVDELPFMLFVVPVKDEYRERLGAITHVDGTARVQTVSRDVSPRYWALLEAFGQRTGYPMLLNTSFNNNVEPIVDSISDAIVCFLTTGLDVLVAGSCLAEKREAPPLDALVPSLPWYAALCERTDARASRAWTVEIVHQGRFGRHAPHPLAEATFAVLRGQDGRANLGQLMDAAGVRTAAARAGVVAEVEALWQARAVILVP